LKIRSRGTAITTFNPANLDKKRAFLGKNPKYLENFWITLGEHLDKGGAVFG